MFRSEGFRRLTSIAAAVLAALVAVMVLWAAKPAEAAFPGANGKIVFSSNRTTGTGVNNPTGDSEIFAMNPDGTGIEQLTFNDAADVLPTWSPQGNAIAFASYQDGNSEIYWMIYGGTFHGLQVRLTNNTVLDENPTFNHDGTKIAFSTHRDGNGEIYVMDISDTNPADGNGDNPINLTKNTAGDFHPAFNHNGTKIAFSAHRGDGDGEIYVMDSDGTDPVKLTNNLTAQDATPEWSPDGTKIAFSTNQDGNYDIYVMNAVDSNNDLIGDNLKRRTKKAADDFRPAWSPDGTKIAFTSTHRGGIDDEIYVMKAAKPEGKRNRPKNLTNNDVVDDLWPDWRPIPQP